MKILVLDLCNYVDYPLGGQLSFVKNLIRAFGTDAKLVGISTDDITPINEWTKKLINGIEYDFYAIGKHEKEFKRPLVPARISSYIQLKPKLRVLLESISYDRIFVQAPEVLMCIPNKYLSRTFMVMPGVENPLSIARYPLAKYFQKVYDYFFLRKTAKLKYIFASADENEISNLITRSKGLLTRNRIVKYPTRYDASIYHLKDRHLMRKELAIPSDEKMFITIGRLSWFKGWKLMIDSFALFLQKEPNSHLYFLGDGEDRVKIDTYIKENKLEKKVTLSGSLPPQIVAKYLNATDVFVMGSFKEGWSTTLVEACACCVPCVVTNFSASEEMIKNGVNGFVLQNRLPKDFSEKMYDSLSLNRNEIISFNEKFKLLAVSHMRESIETVISH